MRRAAAALSVCALAVSQTACYDYLAMPSASPTPAGAPPPTRAPSAVRVALTPSGTARVVPSLGPYQVLLDGTLDGTWPADSLRLRVYASRHEAGFRADHPAGVPIVLAAADVQGMTQRKLNPVKTGMLGILIGAGLVSLPTLIQRAGGGGGTNVEPPPAQP
jgi:hypothetical protein